jgi:gamma-glutamyltranspeptidase
MSKSQGIVLSNTMDDFANPGRPNHFGLHPSEANKIVPGKKPLSSMSPTMVFRRSAEAGTLGQLILVLGASGGPKIISAVVQIFANMVLLGMSLWDSIIHARFHDQLIYHGAAVVTVEDTVLDQAPSINVTQRTRNALISRGHALLDVDYEGTVQAIAIDLETNELTAACDVRKGGSPAGY